MPEEQLKDVKLLGFNITELSVKREEEFKGELRVNSDIKIESLEKQKLDLVQQDVLRVNFGFKITYEELGEVDMKGHLFLLLDEKTTKTALSEWKKNKKLLQDVNLFTVNLILQKCSLKALQLEEELGLPLHMQMPRAMPQQDQQQTTNN
jgi:hypothetical protein